MAPNPKNAAKLKELMSSNQKRKKKSAVKGVKQPRTTSSKKKKQSGPKHREYFTNPSYHFFMLPIELRDKIYNFLANDEDSDGQLYIMHEYSFDRANLSGSLLSTCKSIYEEYTAAIIRSRPTVSATDFTHFQPLLETVGGTGQALIKELELVWFNRDLTGMSHTLGRELRALGLTSAPMLKKLPHLPALKSVKIVFQSLGKWFRTPRTVRPFIPCKELLAQLSDAKAGRNHFLRQYMRAIGRGDDVDWKIELFSQCTGAPTVQPSGTLTCVVENFKIFMRAKIVCVESNNRMYHHLQLEDAATGSTEQFDVWYTDLNL